MRSSRAGLVAAAAMAGLAVMHPGAASTDAEATRTAAAQKALPGGLRTEALRRAMLRGFGMAGLRRHSYPKNSGWTNARYKRAMIKRRNQARHRRACR